MQRGGKLTEADRELRIAIVELGAAGDRPALMKALSIESWVSVSLGNYQDAIRQATEAVQLRRMLHDRQHLADDLNTIALANQNQGIYGAALDYFDQALRADRDAGDAEGEITRLNNIGSVYYFEGRYVDALRFYEQAKSKVDATLSESWNPRRRQLTLGNLAAIYQILGKEETALDLYKDLAGSSQSMPGRERGQLLLNQGALYRRLGDPVKALELYRSAQRLYAGDRYNDGEIGVLRNIGTARVMDLNDPEGALESFSAAWKLARASSNRRLIVQVRIYRSEALRLLHRLKEAAADAQSALEGAKSAGLVEEQWRSLYVLGRIAEETGNGGEARKHYEEAVGLIESMRTGLGTASLRSDFLADKRDVYDALIGLRIREDAPVDEVFQWIERSRARALNERVSLGPLQDLRAIQSRLGADTMLLELWSGSDAAATLWVSSSRAGIVRYAGRIQDAGDSLIAALQNGGEQWRDAGRVLGNALLTGVPPARHLLIVPDGPLSAIPFEVATSPGSSAPLIETSDISYLPSAQFVIRGEATSRTRLHGSANWSRWAIRRSLLRTRSPRDGKRYRRQARRSVPLSASCPAGRRCTWAPTRKSATSKDRGWRISRFCTSARTLSSTPAIRIAHAFCWHRTTFFNARCTVWICEASIWSRCPLAIRPAARRFAGRAYRRSAAHFSPPVRPRR